MLLFALKIDSALLKSSCLCNGRMLRAFCFSSIDKLFFFSGQVFSCATMK